MPTLIKQFGESQTAITFGDFSITCKFTGLTVRASRQGAAGSRQSRDSPTTRSSNEGHALDVMMYAARPVG